MLFEKKQIYHIIRTQITTLFYVTQQSTIVIGFLNINNNSYINGQFSCEIKLNLVT